MGTGSFGASYIRRFRRVVLPELDGPRRMIVWGGGDIAWPHGICARCGKQEVHFEKFIFGWVIFWTSDGMLLVLSYVLLQPG